MELEFLSINFYEIFITILSVVILGFVSICLFFWFKGSNNNMNQNSLNNQSSNNKKKTKKKINLSKSNKVLNGNGDVIIEKSPKNKHIEIKPCPEILEDSPKELKPNIISPPSKPILRKNDDPIMVNEENCIESSWPKIPKDEVEIHRSRQSSLVSESRSVLKENDDSTTKLSRGQKKRLKSKLKNLDPKPDEIKVEIQTNNNTIFDVSDDFKSIVVDDDINNSKKSVLSKSAKRNLNKKIKSNFQSASFGQLSTVDFDDTHSSESSTDDLKLESPENITLLKTDFLNNNPCDKVIFESEIQIKCDKYEFENKDLKREVTILKHKLNEFSDMSATITNLKKENEMLVKKQAELERTCSAMQKELTNSIQKTNTAESRVHRINTERSQQISYFENEINKFRNEISILEGENRSKVAENENAKMNIDQLRLMISEKDQLIQSQSSEMSLMKDQCFKKRHECQEMELQINNISKKCKDLENQNQKLLDENQKIKIQIDINEKENEKKSEKLKSQIKNKEREQNALISSLQYQLDEFGRERQLYICNPEIDELREENEKLRRMHINLERTYSESPSHATIPSGFELIEIEKLKQMTSILHEGNQKLQEKCANHNKYLTQQSDSDKNTIVESNCSKLNIDFKGHLNEIINLRKCIEKLQLELSKNSESNLDEFKVELDEKYETVKKTQVLLSKLDESQYKERNIESDLEQKSSAAQSQTESLQNGSLSVE